MNNDRDPLRRPGSATDAPLPPERAFVVQLRPLLDDPRGEVLVGRVEHITSGAVGRFASAAELTAFIARIGRSATADHRLRQAQTSPERRRREHEMSPRGTHEVGDHDLLGGPTEHLEYVLAPRDQRHEWVILKKLGAQTCDSGWRRDSNT